MICCVSNAPTFGQAYFSECFYMHKTLHRDFSGKSDTTCKLVKHLVLHVDLYSMNTY